MTQNFKIITYTDVKFKKEKLKKIKKVKNKSNVWFLFLVDVIRIGLNI